MKVFTKMGVIVVFVFVTLGPSFAMGEMSVFDFLQKQNIDSPAPDFTLKTLSGKDVNMTKFRDGKRAIIFFWATWCPHCREALRKLNQDKAEIEKRGIKIILVDIGEGAQEVRSHMTKNKIDIDVFLDVESSLAEAYGIIGVPTLYFVDEKGNIQSIEHSIPKNIEASFAKSK